MSGFPGEREDDIDGIVRLSKEVSDVRKELGQGPAKVNASVGWLVPKPYTPLQWAAQPRAEYFHEVRQRMHSLLYAKHGGKKRGAVKIKTHSVERSVLEAVFARGDRKLADSIEYAYKHGARFDGWDECFNSRIWKEAFHATNIDPDFYAHRERPSDEVFPWQHLVGGAPDDYLARQYDDMFVNINVPRPTPAVLPV